MARVAPYSRTTYDLSDRLGTATRSYDAFGMLVASTGTPQGPFGFAGGSGYQEDDDSGLKLLGHRYYDASTGRFLTRDPAGDGRNWYGYCEGNPLRWLDPEGLKPGDKYKTPEDAARAAAAENIGRSVNEHREYGGWIIHNADDSYSYTVVPGNPKESGRVRLGPKPKRADGIWHTHPNPKGAPVHPERGIDPDGTYEGYGDPNKPSGTDRDGWRATSGPDFIVTLNGDVLEFKNPDQKKGKPIGKVRAPTWKPNY